MPILITGYMAMLLDTFSHGEALRCGAPRSDFGNLARTRVVYHVSVSSWNLGGFSPSKLEGIGALVLSYMTRTYLEDLFFDSSGSSVWDSCLVYRPFLYAIRMDGSVTLLAYPVFLAKSKLSLLGSQGVTLLPHDPVRLQDMVHALSILKERLPTGRAHIIFLL